MLIDTHCHLDFPEFDQDRDEVIRSLGDNGISYVINVGSSLEGSRQSLKLAERFACVYATVGIHPHEADKYSEESRKPIEELAKKDKVVAVGEIGLDYYKNYSSPKNQLLLFTSLVGLAKSLGLPVVIHSRQAQNDTLKVLKEAMPLEAVVHCFSGDDNFLKDCLGLGFFVSFTCNITYKKADGLRSLAKSVPQDKLMLETDAPFLAPEGLRGRRNEPKYVKILAEEIAAIKGISFEEISRVTSENAKRFFRLK